MSFTAIIADDETLARTRLIQLLGPLGIQIVGEARDGHEALAMCAELRPQAVFLDIQMPGLTGLNVADQVLHAQNIEVVFLTAHSEFAAAAFELDACDYVLKPATRDRLKLAVDRVLRRLGLAPLSNTLHGQETRIAVQDKGSTLYFAPERCNRFVATDKYTSLSVENHEYLLRDSLDDLETRLQGSGFVRVHRKELIRVGAISRAGSDDEGMFVEVDGCTIRVSRRRTVSVRDALARLGKTV